jgi:hypothetical protein
MGAFIGWQSLKKNLLFANFPNRQSTLTSLYFGFNWHTLMVAGVNTFPNTNGETVSQWRAIAGNAIYSEANDANRPFYTASNPLFKNNPTINCPSTSRGLILTSGRPPIINNKSTFVFVGRYVTLNDFNIILGLSPQFFGLGGTHSGNTGINILTTGPAYRLQSNIKNNQPHVVIIQYGDSDGALMYIDGILEAVSSWNTPLQLARISRLTNNVNAEVALFGVIDKRLDTSDITWLNETLTNYYI